MITLVSVIISAIKDKYLKYLCDSISDNFKLVNEVLLPDADMNEGYVKEWSQNNIKFKIFGCKQHLFPVCSPVSICLDHSLNMHAGIDRAKNDYVYICDPDIFYYTALDEFYMTIKEKYNIHYIGASHHAAICYSFKFFPNVVNLLVHKKDLPRPDWLIDKLFLDMVLKEELKGQHVAIPGKFLVPQGLEGTQHLYPNPQGHFETGCNLVLWAQENNLNWLSFQTSNVNVYTSRFYKSNLKIRENLGNVKMFYHATHGSIKSHLANTKFDEYVKQYVEKDTQ